MGARNRFVALLVSSTAVLFTASACTPGVPVPQISTPPVSGTSTTTASGGSITTHVACVPEGGVVTAHVTRIDTGPEYNTDWMMQIRHLGSDDPDASPFPWQEHHVDDGAVSETIVSDPIPIATCLQVWVMAPNFFDLRSPRFTYTIEW